MATIALGSAAALLVVLIALKIGADAFLHLRKHRDRPPEAEGLESQA